MFAGLKQSFRGLVAGAVLVNTLSCSVALSPASEAEPIRQAVIETTTSEAPGAEAEAEPGIELESPAAQPAPAQEPSAENEPEPQRTLRRLAGHELNRGLVEKAREIIHEHHAEPFGTEIPFELDGREYVGKIERHFHPEGGELRPWGYHPGCSLFVVENG